MPICNRTAIPVGSRKGATEIDDHASEAAKLKRAREQAYFNSYNFDAIEVLHSENEVSGPEDEDDGSMKQKTTKTNRNKTLIKYQTRTANKSQLPATSQSTTDSVTGDKITIVETNSSSDSSNGSKNEKVLGMKYAYLQRLGAFFVNTQEPQATTATVATATTALSTATSSLAATAMIENMQNSKEANIDGNFLLPRAVLKYQSSSNTNVGDSSRNIGASNSMPLSMVTTQLQQQQQLQLHGIGGKIMQSDNKAAAVVMASKTISLLTAQQSPQQNHDGHENGQTGFLTTLQENLAVTKIKTLPRNKKQSTSSTTTTVTTATIGSLELPNSAAIATKAANTTPIGSISHSSHSKNVRNTITFINSKQQTKTTGNNTYKTANCSSSASTESHDALPHGRAHSHQSHYSTDKSGSSGYYSSNVCSTYSIEDHIYCEPVIDILDLNGKQKSKSGKTNIETAKRLHQQQQQHQKTQQQLPTLSGAVVNLTGKAISAETHFNSHTRTMNGNGRSGSDATTEDDDDEEDESNGKLKATRMRNMQQHHSTPQNFSEKLRVLETSIDNLDRHLKKFSSLSSQEHIVSYMQSTHQPFLQQEQIVEKLRTPYNHHLPTIMEGYDPVNQPHSWQHEITDDSLLDIDLDSFLLTNESKDTKHRNGASPVGIDNPTFITDEVEENNYKCAKYINSCPENAYRVDSDIVGTESRGTASQKSLSAEHFLQRYEDQLHFQSTRELLEDVRDKIRVLSKSSSDILTSGSSNVSTSNRSSLSQSADEKPTINRKQSNSTSSDEVPKELESMIKTLKSELESYLDRMNQHSEYEIRQLCSGLVKNDHIVKMKRAFERRRSMTEQDFYEAIEHGNRNAMSSFKAGVPTNIRQQIASIRCASDPNFKMKRKSLCDVFPTVSCYMETANEQRRMDYAVNRISQTQTQLQRNLSFHKPVLNQLESIASVNANSKSSTNIDSHTHKNGNDVSSGRNSTESGESGGDKDSILDWHRKKPSIWEQYYGTNRMHQSLLGKRNGMVVNNTQSSMSYPSSRPESDFTLDLPRAEQLRIKMEKEKKFRQRCRLITTFLSLIFFLLTVMVVSLVLTRGKRMFGSMI